MLTLDIAAPEAVSPSTLISWLGQLPEPTGRDRRAHERLMAEELDWLRSARLRFGPNLSLIDLSASGALFETSAPLRPGSTASLVISGRGVEETRSLRVLRCEVASLQRGLVYRGACVFDRVIQLPGAPEVQSAIAPQDNSSSEDGVLELIQVVSGDSVEPERGKQGQLIAAIRAAVARGHSPASLLRCVERELGVSSRSTSARRASVTLPVPAPPVELAQKLLESAPLPVIGPQPIGAAGWNKLVVRYLDGTVLKGFSQDFHPTRAQFHLTPSIAGGRDRMSLVPMRRLKAIFFVRDFDGDPEYVESRSFADRSPGRRIEVTFADGELMVGTTLGYRPDGTGFFLRPADADGNNLRVFVAPGAVKRVHFL
jgi:hypothetical protein